MAKKSHNLGRFLTAAAFLGAAAGAWYYLKNKAASEKENIGSEEEPDEFDDFDDLDRLDEEEPHKENPAAGPDGAEGAEGTGAACEPKQEGGRSYVSLDLKKAKAKADAFLGNVSEKVEDTVKKIKTSEEYETVANKVDGAVSRFRNSEEFGAVAGKINDTVERIRNSNEYANVDEQMEHALNKVKEVTEKAVNRVGQRLNVTMGNAEEIVSSKEAASSEAVSPEAAPSEAAPSNPVLSEETAPPQEKDAAPENEGA